MTKIITRPTVHLFESSGDAYDASQTRDDISDGDVLVVESERVVGFLVKAWPVAVSDEHGAFHALDPDADVTCLDKRDEKRLPLTICPRKYVVHVNGEPVSEHESPLDAEDAAREVHGVVRPVDLEPYETVEVFAADPGTDYSASVSEAQSVIEHLREHGPVDESALSDDERKLLAYEREHCDDRSFAEHFPLYTRVDVLHPFDERRRKIASGEVIGYVLGWYDHGSPESGLGPVERCELVRVHCDDGKYRDAYPGDLGPCDDDSERA